MNAAPNGIASIVYIIYLIYRKTPVLTRVLRRYLPPPFFKRVSVPKFYNSETFIKIRFRY